MPTCLCLLHRSSELAEWQEAAEQTAAHLNWHGPVPICLNKRSRLLDAGLQAAAGRMLYNVADMDKPTLEQEVTSA